MQFARASGQETALLERRAREPLRRAADRALSLNALDAAARLYAAALELCDRDDPNRGSLLFGYGKSQALGRAEGVETLAEAGEALLRAGDPETAAEAELLISEMWRLRAEGDRVRTHLDAALALVRARPPSPSKVRVLNDAARYHMLTDEGEEALRVGREALAMAEALQLDELRGIALNNLGITRMLMGDRGGRDDLERAIELTIELNPKECLRAFNNLGAGLLTLGDLRAAGAAWDRGRAVGRRFGDVAFARHLALNRINQLYWSGSWEDADRIADDLIAQWEAGSLHLLVIWSYDVRARIRLARGEVDGALDDARKSVEVSRRSKEPQLLLSTLSFGAVAALAAGRDEEAAALAEEVLALRPARRPPQRFAILFDLAVALSGLCRSDALMDELARAEVRTSWVDAAEKYARGAFVRAADVYAKTGALPFEAFARLRAGEQLLADERREDAEAELQLALAFYRSVGASAYAREAEELLTAAGLEIPA